MKCNEILKYISDYIDGDLSPKLNKEIEAHLNECFSCRAIADTLKIALGLCQELEVVRTPVSVHESLHKMLKQEWDLLRVPISLEQPRIMATEIIGKGNKMIIRVEVPGIKKSDINITGSADALEIIVFRERPEGVYYLNELLYGKLEKRFDLPFTIDVSNIKIKIADGILEITTKIKE